MTYTANAGASGGDSFTYQVCDATALCDSATVSVTIQPIVPPDNPPVANDDTARRRPASR